MSHLLFFLSYTLEPVLCYMLCAGKSLLERREGFSGGFQIPFLLRLHTNPNSPRKIELFLIDEHPYTVIILLR